MGLDKIIIHEGRGLFDNHRKASRLLAQQINECIEYINWLENENSRQSMEFRRLEQRIAKLENKEDKNE